MDRKEIEEILKTHGYRETVSIPTDVVDYQRGNPYHRIILFQVDIKEMTREKLLRLIRR